MRVLRCLWDAQRQNGTGSREKRQAEIRERRSLDRMKRIGRCKNKPPNMRHQERRLPQWTAATTAGKTTWKSEARIGATRPAFAAEAAASAE